MASSPAISKFLINFALLSLIFNIFSVSSFQFEVGGDSGWTKPSANSTEPYNSWASENRFRIGDTVYFKYRKDSVLVVDYEDYQNCTTSNPIYKFKDGHTVYEFNRSGFFYFISGQPGHCKAGQKLIIRVLHHSEYVHHPPESAPPPKVARAPGSGDHHGWETDNEGPSALASSSTRLSIASYLTTAIWAVLSFSI